MDQCLADLTRAARSRGMNDTRWAALAGVRKETLSRLRRRKNADYATLAALAAAVGAHMAVRADVPATSLDGLFPGQVDRDCFARLANLAASGNRDPDAWRAAGPAFFMAGLAVALASGYGADRTRLLALAEALHPGASQPEVLAVWLKRSPLRPSDFMPTVDALQRRSARAGPGAA